MKREKTVLEHAYEVFKGSPVDPASIYGDASGPATTNPKKEDEDEEVKKWCRATALFRAQTKSRKIDPPFSLVEKEYEAVLRQVFATQAGDNVTDTRQTSSGVPHGKDETGTSTASKKPPQVGWTPQNQPSGSYRTGDPQILPQPITSLPPNQIGRVGRNRYPQDTYVTTAQVPGSQPQGDTFNAPYRDQTPSGYGPDYDTALGSRQKVEKSQLGGLITALWSENDFGQETVEGQIMLRELEKAAQAGRPGGAQSYQDEDIHAAGAPEKMDEETKRRLLDRAKAEDMAQAMKYEEIADKLEEEAAKDNPTDARLRPREETQKARMARAAREQASDLYKRWNANYPSGPITKKTTRHGYGGW